LLKTSLKFGWFEKKKKFWLIDKLKLKGHSFIQIILGPIFYAVFIDMEKLLETITKWYSQSGLVVNSGKTEICLLHKIDFGSVYVSIDPDRIITVKQMKVLVIIFDAKLKWNAQVSNFI
jgi:hypothetical protein